MAGGEYFSDSCGDITAKRIRRRAFPPGGATVPRFKLDSVNSTSFAAVEGSVRGACLEYARDGIDAFGRFDKNFENVAIGADGCEAGAGGM